MNGFELGLVLKQRQKAPQKLPTGMIRNLLLYSVIKEICHHYYNVPYCFLFFSFISYFFFLCVKGNAK